MIEVEVPNIPHLPDKGVHHVTFVPSDLYIERSDYREVRLLPITAIFKFFILSLVCDEVVSSVNMWLQHAVSVKLVLCDWLS